MCAYHLFNLIQHHPKLHACIPLLLTQIYLCDMYLLPNEKQIQTRNIHEYKQVDLDQFQIVILCNYFYDFMCHQFIKHACIQLRITKLGRKRLAPFLTLFIILCLSDSKQSHSCNLLLIYMSNKIQKTCTMMSNESRFKQKYM